MCLPGLFWACTAAIDKQKKAVKRQILTVIGICGLMTVKTFNPKGSYSTSLNTRSRTWARGIRSCSMLSR